MYSHTPFQKGGVGINKFPKFENECVLLAVVLFKRVMRKGETPDKMQGNARVMEAMSFESSCWVCVGGLFIQSMQRYNFRLCFGVCVVLCCVALCWTTTHRLTSNFYMWKAIDLHTIADVGQYNRTVQQFNSNHTKVEPWCSKNNEGGQTQKQ